MGDMVTDCSKWSAPGACQPRLQPHPQKPVWQGVPTAPSHLKSITKPNICQTVPLSYPVVPASTQTTFTLCSVLHLPSQSIFFLQPEGSLLSKNLTSPLPCLSILWFPRAWG